MSDSEDKTMAIFSLAFFVVGVLIGIGFMAAFSLNVGTIIEQGGFEDDGKVYLVVPAPEAIRITPDGPAKLLVDNQPED